MTGTAFLKRLRFQLDFLNEEDQEVVLSFYENKIGQAITLTEEEEVVKSFGSPEAIAEKLKALYLKHQEEEIAERSNESDDEKSETIDDEIEMEENLKEDAESDHIVQETPAETKSHSEEMQSEEQEEGDDIGNTPETKDESDLIFSRPDFAEHSSEVLHDIEFDDVKTIYGEKVVIYENSHEPIAIDPDEDDHNGFTTVEIELAKAETLKKAKDYNTDSIRSIESIESEDESELKSEENKEEFVANADPSPAEEIESEEKKVYEGLFNRPFANNEANKALIVFCKVLFTVLLSPVLIFALTSVTVIYAVFSVICILVSILLFALTLGVIILGIIELVYGITLLFDTISVALIEIGLGTALFGLVTALSAFIYQFLFGIIPTILKKITKQFKKLLKTILCYFYGGRV